MNALDLSLSRIILGLGSVRLLVFLLSRLENGCTREERGARRNRS